MLPSSTYTISTMNMSYNEQSRMYVVTFDKEPQLYLGNESPAMSSIWKELCFPLREEINIWAGKSQVFWLQFNVLPGKGQQSRHIGTPHCPPFHLVVSQCFLQNLKYERNSVLYMVCHIPYRPYLKKKCNRHYLHA